MSDQNLIIEIDNGIAKLILNRPDVHNAFDDILIEEIIQALSVISNDDSVRAVVVTSTGCSDEYYG